MKKILLVAMAIVSTAFGSKAQDADYEYVPLVREGVEWGYLSYLWGPWGNCEFFRLQFQGTTEIGGKTYHNLYRYTTFNLIPEKFGNKPVAYMREEGKKVYGMVDLENLDFQFPYPGFYNDLRYGEEALMFDFTLEDGDVFTSLGSLDEELRMHCVGTGYTDTPSGKRHYVDLVSNYVYEGPIEDYTGLVVRMVEGFGPMLSQESLDSAYGASILFPYPAYAATIPVSRPKEWPLYERKVLAKESYVQGPKTLLTPLFDLYGVHDPSVWGWSAADNEDPTDAKIDEVVTAPVGGEDDAPKAYYNLSGQKVDRDTAQPGVYIKAGSTHAEKVLITPRN